MREVTIKLKFTTPCLGDVRDVPSGILRLRRDGVGRVVIMPNVWKLIINKSAPTCGVSPRICKSIRWDPVVDGEPKLFERMWSDESTGGSKRGVDCHESFPAGAIVGIRALVPDDLTPDQLSKILNVAGSFCGVSPWGHRHGFGRFVVEDIRYAGDDTEMFQSY